MESYFSEIKQLRIPRPRYEPSGSPLTGWQPFGRPYTPPQDYDCQLSSTTESYFSEIKQLRIPRPKYEPSGSPPIGWQPFGRPYTPPEDYHLPSANERVITARTRNYQNGDNEEFPLSLHGKM